jgi:hypothetical protein
MNDLNTCRWFDAHLNAYLDGELDREQRERINQHARTCPECGQKLETTTRLLTMCAELDEGLTVPLDAQAAWRAAVRKEAAGRKRTARISAWTKGAGWIAAALTLLVVSTHIMGSGGVVVPVRTLGAGESPGTAGGIEAYGYDEYGYISSEPEIDMSALTISGDGAIEGAVASSPASSASESARVQIVLRTARRDIESAQYDADSRSIDDLVGEYAGYFESGSESGQPLKVGEYSGRRREMLIRIPSGQLDEFLESLDVVGTVTYRNETAQDVSSQYYDVNAQLEALKLQRDRLNELVGSADDLANILALEDKFYEVQGEINALEGRLRDWNSKADLAQVSVTLTEVPVRTQVQPVGDSLIKRIQTGFFDSVNWLSGFLQDMAVVLVSAVPVLVVVLPIIVLIAVVVKVVRARRRK